MSAKADQETVGVGLLGVGLMGSAMAHRLLDRGLAVIAWDRDAERLRALEGRGGEPVERPSEVVSLASLPVWGPRWMSSDTSEGDPSVDLPVTPG